jgi:hypothetical protein
MPEITRLIFVSEPVGKLGVLFRRNLKLLIVSIFLVLAKSLRPERLA